MASDFEQVVKKLEQEIDEHKKNEDYVKVKDLQMRLGTLYLNQGDAPKALTHFEDALKLAQEQEDQVNEARLLGVKGKALVSIGNAKQALQSFNKSKKVAEKIEHIPILIDAHTYIGKLQFESGEVEKGIKNLEKAYRTAFESSEKQREMHIAGMMGNVFMALEQHGKAMEFYSIALDISKELENLEAESQFQICLGHIYLLKEDYAPAEEHFKNALDIGSRQKNTNIEFAAFENLLDLSITLDDFGMAIFNGGQAIKLAREIEDIGAEAQNIRTLTNYLFEKGEFAKTLPFLARGLELAEIGHDKVWQMDSTSQMGFAHYFVGELEKAEEELSAAYQLATQMQKPVELAKIGGKLGAVKAELGQYDAAIAYSEEAVNIAKAQKLPELEGEQLVLLAMTYYDVDKAELAKDHIQQAIELYRELEQPEMLQQAEAVLESFS